MDMNQRAKAVMAQATASVTNENVTKEGIEVKVGQVWRDLDKRMEGRFCKVVEVYRGAAKMRRCSEAGVELSTGSETRVAVRRMHKNSTGWALVSE